jgi:hypothetical protein
MIGSRRTPATNTLIQGTISMYIVTAPKVRAKKRTIKCRSLKVMDVGSPLRGIFVSVFSHGSR